MRTETKERVTVPSEEWWSTVMRLRAVGYAAPIVSVSASGPTSVMSTASRTHARVRGAPARVPSGRPPCMRRLRPRSVSVKISPS